MFGAGVTAGSRKLGGKGDSTRFRCSISRSGSGGRPCASRRVVSGSRTRLVGTNVAARDAEHGRVRHAEALGGDGGAEVDLVSHDDVGRPGATDRDERVGSLARDAAGERRPDRARLTLGVDGEQRQALLRRQQAGSAGGECREPGRLDRRDHPLLTRERDDVTGPLGRAGNRDERQEVTRAAGEGEQNPHRVIQAETRSRSSGMMSREAECREPAACSVP